MENNQNTPFAALDPNLILDAIESVGFQCTGSLSALNSYENRVYQIGIEDSAPLIAKFYRPLRWSNEAILEEHQFSLTLAEHEIPVVAPILSQNNESLHHYKDFRFALFPKRGGRTLELGNLEHLEWMGRFIGRLHAIGACQSFQHRPALDIQTHGYEPYHYLLEHNFIPAHLKQSFCSIVDAALEKITHYFEQAGEIKMIRLHGDCHAGNVLWNDTGPQIVDLDDSVMGPAVQDFWMLLCGDTLEQNQVQLQYLLRGYRAFYDFNLQELKLIPALRKLRVIQYAAWLAARWEDPAFPTSFPWFNTDHYWEEWLRDLSV